jgi:hypothetical protein
VPTFRITYRPELDRAREDVEADRADVEGGNGMVVLRGTVLLMGRPREVVVRRLSARDVLSVDPVADA